MEQEITALKVQKRNPNRVNVYLDGEYAFGLARVVAAWLKVGDRISQEKIKTLAEKDGEEVALQKALKFISYRPRSETEVKNRLVKNGVAPLVADSVIDRLRGSDLVGDRQFAQNWVENRATFRPRSHRLLELELRQKGVAENVILDALGAVEDDENLAYNAAIKKIRSYSGLEWEKFRQRLSGFLARRGFSYDVIAPTVERVWSEIDDIDNKQASLDEEVGNEKFN